MRPAICKSCSCQRKVTNPFCLRAWTRQAGVLTVATTLPACTGHWGSVCAASCHFDGAQGARWVPPSTHSAQACHSVREMYRRAPPPATLPCFSSDTLHLPRLGGTRSLKFTGDISGQRPKEKKPRLASIGARRNVAARLLRTCKCSLNVSRLRHRSSMTSMSLQN